MYTIIRKQYRQFVRFVRRRVSTDWQQSLARVCILGSMATLVLLTVCLGVARLNGSVFAQVTLGYVAVAAGLACLLYVADRKRWVGFGGVLLVALYWALGVALMSRVSVGAGAAILFAMAVVSASALYGFWFALVPTVLSTAAMVLFRALELSGKVHPEYVYVPRPDSFDTVVAVAMLLHVLLVASGLVHHYLLLANLRLQTAEAEKVGQLYRFAEIGEISIALMHDLANKLSSLSLEVESLPADDPTARRLQRKVLQLNTVLTVAREQMNGRHNRQRFDVGKEVTRIVSSLRLLANQAGVILEWEEPGTPLAYSGEKILFQQVVTILIKNAIDSYGHRQTRTPRRVQVSLVSTPGSLQLSIIDWGKGIKPSDRPFVFKPFYSTKKDGMGMGLYLTKRFIEDSFGGTVAMQIQRRRTEFSVSLPRGKARRTLR